MWANCPLVNNGFADFNKIENCPYMREGEGSILGTLRLKKLLKINKVRQK